MRVNEQWYGQTPHLLISNHSKQQPNNVILQLLSDHADFLALEMSKINLLNVIILQLISVLVQSGHQNSAIVPKHHHDHLPEVEI